LLFELDALLPQVEFVSIGSNDLMQFLFAADRTNALVGSRYDVLSVAPLRALQAIAKACRKHKVALTLCGEMAGRPVEAMTLIGLGFKTLSMSPASVGPIKAMVLSLDAKKTAGFLDGLLREETGTVRGEIEKFARSQGVAI
jgi:phosphotransferase system enzyme I (PtsP)